jgi:hypothetical protein
MRVVNNSLRFDGTPYAYVRKNAEYIVVQSPRQTQLPLHGRSLQVFSVH